MAKAKTTKKQEIKFTQEELNSLNVLKVSFENLQNQLGSIEINRIQTESQLQVIEDEKLRLEAEYSNLKDQEGQLVATLNEKYGRGQLDPTTGVFTPQK